jgi:hypothetical protein
MVKYGRAYYMEAVKLRLGLLVLALGGGLTADVVAQQPNYGCLAQNTCGRKGTTSNTGPRDYWQNWICSGCHMGVSSNYVQSPPERALINVPDRFWFMHAEARRDGETAVKAGMHRLHAESRITTEFRRLIAERRGR